jgi:O-antigen/teichoic acid export membrane protein
MLGAGLFLHRKTRTIMTIVLSCAVLNIVLNLLLVPRLGIEGSAIVTLVCYAAAALAMAAAGHALLPVELPWGMLLRAGVASLAMYFAVARLFPGHRLSTVGVRAAAGGVVYGAIMVLISAEARALVRSALGRLRPKAGR